MGRFGFKIGENLPKSMISIIISSFKEPKTIGKAIESFLKQKLPEHELIVVAPDDETLIAAEKMKKKYGKIRLIKDKGEGKPSALNLAVSKARGDTIVFSDGDVFVSENSVMNLLEKFENPSIGAVTGRPAPINDRNSKFGFWAYVLTEIADERRKRAIENKRRLFCSGYLFAARKKAFPKLPKELLSEDGYISHKIYEKGFLIDYSPDARVFVKYPDNFDDWVKQKKRSAGGYNQIKKMLGVEIRSFKSESLGGFELLKYVKGLVDFIWLMDLFLSRVYLWFLIYRDINLKKKSQKEIWQRVESTK